MPLPVLHQRFAQAAVKMVTAPTGPVAALSERPVGSNSTVGGRWCTSRSPDVSLRGAKRRGNLGKAVAVSPVAFPRCGRVLRDCHVGLRPPRNDNSGAFAILTAVCTDCKCVAGPGCPLPYNGRCGRRSATKPAACKALRERRYRRKLPKCSRAGYRGRRTGRSWQWGRALCRAAFSTGNGRRQGPPAQEASGYPAQGHHRGA